MSLIEIKNAGFEYDGTNVFHGVNANIEKGEICCLMGPNGCGKSTLLDCVLGFLCLREGEITVDGRKLSSYKKTQLAKKIAYVPQIHNSTFPYTVMQIVLMGRTAHTNTITGPDVSDAEAAKECLDMVGILPLAERPYTQTSGGEMQLVMLARALVQDTPVIIMDEPTAHLDFRNELVFMETAVKLVDKKKVSIFMATHSPNQAFYFENKGVDVNVLAMCDNGIACAGRPSDVLSEDVIRQVYRIESRRLDFISSATGNLCQVVPISTI